MDTLGNCRASEPRVKVGRRRWSVKQTVGHRSPALRATESPAPDVGVPRLRTRGRGRTATKERSVGPAPTPRAAPRDWSAVSHRRFDPSHAGLSPTAAVCFPFPNPVRRRLPGPRGCAGTQAAAGSAVGPQGASERVQFPARSPKSKRSAATGGPAVLPTAATACPHARRERAPPHASSRPATARAGASYPGRPIAAYVSCLPSSTPGWSNGSMPYQTPA